MKITEKKISLGGRDLILRHGEYAEQASGAIVAQLGETVVLATVAVGGETDKDYFPLSVEYQERLYAGGKIKGSRWVKRDGRPSDDEILSARVIDRSIRPLFPKGFNRDVQVIITVLSVDGENNPVDIAPIAVSAAVEVSSLIWNGPVSVIRIGLIDGKHVINPLYEDMKKSPLDLVVSSTKDSVVMIEAGANEVEDKLVLEGVDIAHKESQKIVKFISDLAKEVSREKIAFEVKEPSEELSKKVKALVGDKLTPIIKLMAEKENGFEEFGKFKKEIIEQFAKDNDEDDDQSMLVGEVVERLLKYQIRDQILSGTRPDGRKHKEIRELISKVGVLPRTHGSGMFKRGSTQVLSVATLGSPSMGQLLESAEGEEEKNYIHHYEMPPYATGETGRIGSPNRREIGHGALAERALIPVIPSQEEFPYTILVKSEVFSSNGSSSMASTCGSTLALMDAGVPIKAPVSGIAMGIVIESEEKYAILSDIMGIEDFNGDMDFKVTGTEKGVTAMQMDVKTLMLTPKILAEAVVQANEGRAHILENMIATIDKPNTSVSKYAPKITTFEINPEKIGIVIGPSGKMIKKIAAETGAEIDINDDGTVNVSGVDQAGVEKAVETIKNITKDVVAGEIYEGEVKRIESFGAFVEILPGKDGMVHVSDMSAEFVRDANDVVSIGDKVQVRVKEVDRMGRINLSMLLDPSADEKKDSERGSNGGGNRGGSRGGDRRNDGRRRSDRNDRNSSDRRGSFGRRDNNRSGNSKSSGPHFPASRLVASNPNKSRR